LFVMPILLGEGAPLTGRLHKNVDLTLVKSDALARGVMKLTYAVAATATAHEEPAQAAPTPEPSPPAAPEAQQEALAPYPPEANAEQDA
jgi:hypothetical protein